MPIDLKGNLNSLHFTPLLSTAPLGDAARRPVRNSNENGHHKGTITPGRRILNLSRTRAPPYLGSKYGI